MIKITNEKFQIDSFIKATSLVVIAIAIAIFIDICVISTPVCFAKESLSDNGETLDKNSSFVIHAAGDYNYPPYEFLDPSGEPTGFNVDVFRAVCDAMKIKYDIRLDEWDSVRSQLENGDVNVITGMYFSPERDKKVDFSTPHIVVSHALFVRKKSDIRSLEDLSGKEVVVQKGDIMHDFLQSQARSLTIIPVPDQVDALRLLSEGKHDCALISKLQGLYLIHKYKVDGIEVVGTSVQQRDYCFAVREGDERLLTQLNEGLAILNTRGIYSQIHNKWFGVYEEDEAWKMFIKYLLWAAIPLSIMFIGVIVWNRVLKRHIEIAEIALQRRENIYREFVELAVDGIVLGSPEGLIIEINQVLCEMLQIPHEELIGKHICLLPWDSETIEKKPLRFDLLNSGQTVTTTREIQRKDGSKIHIEMRSKRMSDGSYQSIFRDITERINSELEREKLMSQLAQAQKMEAVGRLAGGIAHDFNNMLGVIIGYADISMLELSRENKVYGKLEAILKAANRSAELTRQLLAFARKQTIMPRILELNSTIEGVLSMIRRLIGEGVELVWKPFLEGLWQIKMDPTQIDQILTNLCVNGRDALSGVGKITIETQNTIIPEDYCLAQKAIASGKYVILSVSDNGCGMDNETISHIFEPFYTTKAIGQGTGLGLATVYGIVEQNNGFINVQSEVGKGTTFKIFIPRYDESLEIVGQNTNE